VKTRSMMKIDCGVYQIENSINGNRYVGSAARVQRRWTQHKSALIKGKHENKHLQRAFNLYGLDAFVFTQLLACDKNNLLLFEQRAIDIIKPEYNIYRRAGSALGVKVSEETKNKISRSLSGHTFSDEAIEKMRAAKLGKRHNYKHIVTEETKEKIRNALTGRPLSDETKRKMSASRQGDKNPFWGRRHTEESKEKNRIAHSKRTNDEHNQNNKTISETG